MLVVSVMIGAASCSRECKAINVPYAGRVEVEILIPPGADQPSGTLCIDDLCASLAQGSSPELMITGYDGHYVGVIPIGSHALAGRKVPITVQIDGDAASVEAPVRNDQPRGKGCSPTVRVVRVALNGSRTTLRVTDT